MGQRPRPSDHHRAQLTELRRRDLSRELGRHLGLDADPALAVIRAAERSALPDALHERARGVRKRRIDPLPACRGRGREPLTERVEPLAAQRGDEDRGGELRREGGPSG